jgi:hypothetical protein
MKDNVEYGLYVRKPFEVKAVRVTEENMDDVADWCSGKLRTNSYNVPYIHVDVRPFVNARQTKAFVGDWILFAARGFKVYTDKAFRASFVPVEEEKVEPAPSPATLKAAKKS